MSGASPRPFGRCCRRRECGSLRLRVWWCAGEGLVVDVVDVPAGPSGVRRLGWEGLGCSPGSSRPPAGDSYVHATVRTFWSTIRTFRRRYVPLGAEPSPEGTNRRRYVPNRQPKVRTVRPRAGLRARSHPGKHARRPGRPAPGDAGVNDKARPRTPADNSHPHQPHPQTRTAGNGRRVAGSMRADGVNGNAGGSLKSRPRRVGLGAPAAGSVRHQFQQGTGLPIGGVLLGDSALARRVPLDAVEDCPALEGTELRHVPNTAVRRLAGRQRGEIRPAC